jgi:crossover junction endonuclease MUS81
MRLGLKMIVDYRERDLSAAISASGLEHVTDNLHVGDIAISDGSETIVERKTWDDFWASITDGRFKEQKERLKMSGLNVIFLLEDTRFVDGRILVDSNPAFKGAFISLLLSKRWKVICTRNVQESADILVAMERKMKEWEGTVGGSAQPVIHSKSQISKKSCKTPEDCALAALTCIRGVSAEKAKTIMEELGSIQQLTNVTPDALAEIKCGTKRRRIGKDLATRIQQTLTAGQKTNMEQ